jgi:hypothetical protein
MVIMLETLSFTAISTEIVILWQGLTFGED